MKYGIDEKHVKIIGRTLTDRGIRWFGASGSGIDFFLKARSAKLLFDGDDTTLGNTLGGPARIAIYMDGTKVRDFLLTEPQMEVTLWDEKETEEKVFAAKAAKTELAPPTVQPVRITVVKLSECSVSLMGIEAVETDDAAPGYGGRGHLEYGVYNRTGIDNTSVSGSASFIISVEEATRFSLNSNSSVTVRDGEATLVILALQPSREA